MHSAIPCETFSIARDDCDMVRSDAEPMGMSGLSTHRATDLFRSNCLLHFTLDVAVDVVAGGGEVTIENPAPRSDVRLKHVYWKAKAHHANLFRTQPMLEYAANSGSVEITTPLCASGLDMQKYITVLATRRAAVGLAPLDGLVCNHSSHAEKAYGTTTAGLPAARLSGRYPYVFCVVLACAHLSLAPPGIDTAGESPMVVPAEVGLRAGFREQVATLHTSTKVDAPEAPRAVSFLPPQHAYDTEDVCGVCAFTATVGGVCAGRRETEVRASHYEAPDGPGWWEDVDEGDLSDEGDDIFSVESGPGMCQAYHACVKVQTTALKAAVRTKYSIGPGGEAIRHDVPRGYDEAATHPESAKLWEASIREYEAHMACGTWVLRPASECYQSGKFPIDCMWIYDCKVDKNTQDLVLWKARLVARGDQTVYLRDYMATYSGVVRHSTWRLFLAVCASRGLLCTGADVSTAYLHAPLRDYVVWMKQPRGFEQTLDGEAALCRLQMAIYGLKQSAREWATTVIGWLVDWGFKQCTSDRYLFVYEKGDDFMVLLIWVDDIFMGNSSTTLRHSFMTAFKERFRVKDLGPLTQALGASVAQSLSEGWVSFSLEKYISDLARRFELLENVAWADIPVPVAMAKDCIRAVVSDAEVLECVELYAVQTGSVVFIATFARPDVAYAAHFLATFMVRPGRVHLRLVRRVLGYLSRTKAMSITYRKGSGDPSFSFSPLEDGLPDESGLPHMQTDTDHGIARSISGWLFMVSGAAASWAVRAQVLPSLSSSESELYGLSTGVCDLLVCVQVLEEMRVVFTAPVVLMTDSRGARLLTQDQAAAARTRHIHRRWYFVTYHIVEGRLKLLQVKGSLNHSNFLTKAVGGAPFAADRNYSMGIRGATQ